MLFFQVLLLGGYAYSHFLISSKNLKRQTIIHVAILVIAAITLPITPAASWKPLDGTQPTIRILLLLAANVGVPYFILASTGPLVQAWYTRFYPDRSPYRLYALSNLGSLGALLSYPFFVEPSLTTGMQGSIWSIAFVAYAVLGGGLAFAASRQKTVDETPEVNDELGEEATDGPPSLEHRMAWLSLPALASMMLLAITNHLCQDVAVVPFFWVAPLSLYLISFIISFDHSRWYRRLIFSLVAAVAIFFACFISIGHELRDGVSATENFNIAWHGWPYFGIRTTVVALFSFVASAIIAAWRKPQELSRVVLMLAVAATVIVSCVAAHYLDNSLNLGAKGLTAVEVVVDKVIDVDDVFDDMLVESIVYLAMMFLICMLCHGEVVRCKPAPKHLTSFYLMISAGGALGGLFVALVCPQVFSDFIEMGIGIVLAFMLALAVLADSFWNAWVLNRLRKQCVAFACCFGLLIVVVRAQFVEFSSDMVVSQRNFYGRLSVDEDNSDEPLLHIRELMNGHILHGSQFVDEDLSLNPTTYYDETSGIGLAIHRFPNPRAKRVATVGLGTGTIAAYAHADDYYCFYEINPNVCHFATTEFTYLSDAKQRGASVAIELGDARISFERQEPQAYDIIALDAFSGDAIPAHLLTREAFAEYIRHLSDDGIIAVHISNRHLDLRPVVGGIAEHFEYAVLIVESDDDGFVGEAGSDWLLLTRNADFLDDYDVEVAAEVLTSDDYKEIRPWTDQFSNLFEILDTPEWLDDLKQGRWWTESDADATR